MSKIDEVLAGISDGAWHNSLEIANTLKIDYSKLEKIVNLLKEFSLIQKKGHKIRIDLETKKLLKSVTKDLAKT
jgi:3-hydroxyisobutyrate dehydrogenase-like beta-hydroxyacid dehydrogenase